MQVCSMSDMLAIASYAVIFTLMMILFPVWIDDRSKNVFVYIWWCFQLGERSRNDCAYRIFVAPWLVVITSSDNTTAQLHSTKSLLNSGSVQVQILLAVCRRFVIVWISYTMVPTGETRLNAFHRSSIPQKQFIIIIIIMACASNQFPIFYCKIDVCHFSYLQ